MTPTPEKLKELRELASRATPGPWVAESNKGTPLIAFGSTTKDVWIGQVFERARRNEFDVAIEQGEDDAAFIAACDPTTVLALLSRLDALEKALEVAKGALEFYADPSSWRGVVHESPGPMLADVQGGRGGGYFARSAIAEIERGLK